MNTYLYYTYYILFYSSSYCTYLPTYTAFKNEKKTINNTTIHEVKGEQTK